MNIVLAGADSTGGGVGAGPTAVLPCAVAATGAGAGAGAGGGAAACSGLPHEPQNLNCGGFSVPQFEHARADAADGALGMGAAGGA
jgi:hypothetical protein